MGCDAVIRVGLGYDIHRTKPGERLVLGGVEFDSPFGLDGHSDADVVLHALMDAMLGGVALGDIGVHFPPTEEAFRNVSSLRLLRETRSVLRDARYIVGNADIVIVAQSPRIAPKALQMRMNIAEALEINVEAISIKATTNEEVGPEGRAEAI
ncbi:MAG: 2-C-methyl-D-erythritol 2,4-cyclodiphosphate synthase, partial [Chloroflexota bacterium]